MLSREIVEGPRLGSKHPLLKEASTGVRLSRNRRRGRGRPSFRGRSHPLAVEKGHSSPPLLYPELLLPRLLKVSALNPVPHPCPVPGLSPTLALALVSEESPVCLPTVDKWGAPRATRHAPHGTCHVAQGHGFDSGGRSSIRVDSVWASS
jgi:hypothetical protein